MKLFFDFFPVLLFFISYKIFDLYVATAVAMLAAIFQLIFHRIKYQHYEKIHLISLTLIITLGGATLFFHNPWFIKWKPTGIYWLTAIVFFLSSLLGKKPLIQNMMEKNINLNKQIWSRLNYAWCLFFAFMGALNLYVAYYYSTDIWVNFKLFGGIGLTLLFVFFKQFTLLDISLKKQIRHKNQIV